MKASTIVLLATCAGLLWMPACETAKTSDDSYTDVYEDNRYTDDYSPDTYTPDNLYPTEDGFLPCPDVACATECAEHEQCVCGQCKCLGLSCGEAGICCGAGEGCVDGACAVIEPPDAWDTYGDTVTDSWSDLPETSDSSCPPSCLPGCAPNQVCTCGECVCKTVLCGDEEICCQEGEGCNDGQCLSIYDEVPCVPSSFTFPTPGGGQACLTINAAECSCKTTEGYAETCLFVLDLMPEYVGASPNLPWTIEKTEPDVGSGAYVEELPLDTDLTFYLKNTETNQTIKLRFRFQNGQVVDLSIEC